MDEQMKAEAGLSPILYHWTRLWCAANILRTKKFRLTPSDSRPSNPRPWFLSTTRSRIGGYHIEESDGVVFVLDGVKLGHKYLGKPHDFFEHYPEERKLVEKTPRKLDEMEDRIYSKSEYISILPYTKEIHVYEDFPHGDLKKVADLANDLDIPCYVYPDNISWRNMDKRKAEKPKRVAAELIKILGKLLKEMNKREWKKKLLGSYEDWSDGDWVHYTDVNKLGINPKQFHQDLAGIYLFPKDFKTGGTLWKSKKYKITVKIKDTAKILDLSKLTKENMFEIIDTLKIPLKYFPYEDLNADKFWESLKSYYILQNKKQPGKWTKDFIKLGYDAVFDDTDSIHISEVQVVVLNPKILEVVDVATQNIKRGQYGRIQDHLSMLSKLLKPFGSVEIEPLTKSKQGKHIGKLKLIFENNKYISWEVEEDEANQELWIRANHTNISKLRDNWGHFNDTVWMEYGNENKIKELVDRVMKKVKNAGIEVAASIKPRSFHI